jgi:hypothetical protein
LSAIAVIAGIDDYGFRPLSSAVNDAVAFRDALLELGLVAPHEVVLLTSPTRDGARPATRRELTQALFEVYDRGARVDRLYCYFAGHGLSAHTGASRSAVATALIPPEVGDLRLDANLLLNFDDLVARLELAGPAEQFFFVDACRDLAFGERPADLPASLGWPDSSEPRDGPCAQAVLYAVSPGGQALGEAGGMGVMTRHLLDALRGHGVALDWSDEEDAFVITAQSVARHVGSAVRAAIEGQPLWRQRYMAPELRTTGAVPALRVVADPPPRMLTLAFVPQEASEWTDVRLTQRGDELAEPRWPPRQAGEAVALRPVVYRVRALTQRGTVVVEPPKLDARLTDRVTIRVEQAPPPPVPSPAVSGPGEAELERAPAPRRRGGPVRAGGVTARADEPGTTIELEQRDPPYGRWETGPELRKEGLAPGTYAIRFRVGPDVYSETEFELAAGERADLSPTGAHSALLAEASAQDPDGITWLSESLGPVRAGSLTLALTMIGVLPFDETGELFGHLRELVAPLVAPASLDEFVTRPVRVVVAADGGGWMVPPSEVVAGLRLDGEPLARLDAEDGGWGRVAHATFAAPGPSFTLRLVSPELGEIELAAASLAGRVTVIAIVLRADGTAEVMQHLLRVPGRDYPEFVPHVAYARMLRELTLGQRLYESGDLLARGTDDLQMLLYAKWTDPILGCMAYHGLREAHARKLPEALAFAPELLRQAAYNLVDYFPELPDARVVGALEGLPEAAPLGPDEVPVLASSLRAAAGPEIDRWAARVPPDSVWTLTWRPP